MRKPCGERLKGCSREHVRGWDQMLETSYQGTAVDTDPYLLFDLCLRQNLYQSLHDLRQLDYHPWRSKSTMWRNGDHKSPLLSSAARSPPEHPATYPALR